MSISQFMQSIFSGHRIEEVPEIPLVLSDKVQELKKTKEAVTVLRKLKVWSDIEKVLLRVCFHDLTVPFLSQAYPFQ